MWLQSKLRIQRKIIIYLFLTALMQRFVHYEELEKD